MHHGRRVNIRLNRSCSCKLSQWLLCQHFSFTLIPLIVRDGGNEAFFKCLITVYICIYYLWIWRKDMNWISLFCSHSWHVALQCHVNVKISFIYCPIVHFYKHVFITHGHPSVESFLHHAGVVGLATCSAAAHLQLSHLNRYQFSHDNMKC